MQTLKDRIVKYCQENSKDIPYGRHLGIIGTVVIGAIKNSGGYGLVQKQSVVEELWVNAFPDELLQTVDEIISRYFADPWEFVAVGIANKKKAVSIKKPQKFAYDIHHFKAQAFEAACTKMEIPFEKNEGFGNKRGLVQYILPVIPFPSLINLGRVFHKERQLEKQRYWQQHLKNELVLPPPPVEEVQEDPPAVAKPPRKRTTSKKEP